jgi:chromosome segregation ATPase
MARVEVPWLPEGSADPAQILPQRYLGGYDIAATRRVLANAEAAYLELAAERDVLADELEQLQAAHAGLEQERETIVASHQADREATEAEVRKLKDEVARLTASETTLRALWENAEKEMTLAQQTLQTLQQEAGQIAAELEAQRGREHELAELQRQVERNLEQFDALEQEQTELRRARDEESQQAAAREAALHEELAELRERASTLAGQLHEEQQRAGAQERELASRRRREDVLSQMIDAAKKRAETIRADAREEAALTLKKAREKEGDILGQAASRLKALEAEQRRISSMADDLREDLSSVLLRTLQELNSRLENEGAPAEVERIETRRRPARKKRAPVEKTDESASAGAAMAPARIKRSRTGT